MYKNITIITANYYPEDTAIGLYTNQFAEFIAQKGYKVTIVTGFPYYPQWRIYPKYKNFPKYYTEIVNDITIIRYKQYIPDHINFKGRIALMSSLIYGSFVNIFKVKKSDLVICIVPFTLSVIPAILLSKVRKAKLWIHIQDFEFDLAFDSGIIKKKYSVSKILKYPLVLLERVLLNSADSISSISYTMLKKIAQKSSHKNPYYFPNWVSANQINPFTFKNHHYINPNKFTLLYSGNIGEKQNWELFYKLCDQLKINNDDAIEIIIVGDGSYLKTLLQRISDYNFVTIYPPVPYHELSDLLCSADLHFLFQKNDVVDSIMPSKILGMMASARPSIISGNSKSETSTIIKQSEGGVYVDDDDVLPICSHILRIKEDNEYATTIGLNARNFILTKFSEEQVLNDAYSKIKKILS